MSGGGLSHPNTLWYRSMREQGGKSTAIVPTAATAVEQQHNNEFVAYTKSPDNCYTQNGILRVKPSLLADTKDITKDSLFLDG
ncbi:unnamed protein product [Timema podura]|uniref:Uncharacterized protein n=1 Tax=Timema podura TaxID=61482 RepID=A0ABN7P704_TIMPD|nr:unnamed protein product [Timema podura]